jgi:hypothetical protein
MGYYEDPYGDQEPTEEDYCAMGGHPLGLDPQDPESGWHTCFCRASVKPTFDEPHDEFSALHANLRDEYISLVLRSFTVSDTPYGRVDVQRFNLHRKLREFSIEDLQELIAITKDSNPVFFETVTNPRDILTIGTHLDRNGHVIISSIISEMLLASEPNGRRWLFSGDYSESLDDPERRNYARVAAKLYSKLIISYGFKERDQTTEVLRAVYAPLSRQPERLSEVATLINGKGVSPESAQLALALLNGEVEAAPVAISSGLL